MAITQPAYPVRTDDLVEHVGAYVDAQAASGEYINAVRDGGLTGDGITDDEAAGQTLLDNAPDGSTIYFPNGRYLRATGAWDAGGKTLRLVGDPGTVFDGPPDEYALTSLGTVASAVNLTANATRALGSGTGYLPQLEITSTTGINAGDYLRIGSTAVLPLSVENARQGEFIRVRSVDSGTELTLWSPLHDDYTTANGAYVQKVTFGGALRVEGIQFANSDPDTGPNGFIHFGYLRGFRIVDCGFSRCDQRAVAIGDCLDWQVTGCDFRDFEDRNTTPLLLGYGVSTWGASMHGLVSKCSFERLRHGFTTNGINGPGQPRHITVESCTGWNCTNAPFDTHGEGEFITFRGCRAVGGAEWNGTDQGSGSGYGFQVRNSHTRIIDCESNGARVAGLHVYPDIVDLKVLGMVVENMMWTSYASAQGARIAGDNHTIRGLIIDGTTDEGLQVSGDGHDIEVTLRNTGGAAIELQGPSDGMRMRARVSQCPTAIAADDTSGGSVTDAEIELNVLDGGTVGNSTWVV